MVLFNIKAKQLEKDIGEKNKTSEELKAESTSLLEDRSGKV